MVTTAPLSGPLARPTAAAVLAVPHDPDDGLPTDVHPLAAALACPDRFLVSTPPALADGFLRRLMAAARDRGERLLVLTADAAAADRLVEAISTQDSGVVRAMVESEDAEALPAAVRATSSRIVGAGRVAETRAKLADTLRAAAFKLEHWAVGGTWDRLRERATPVEPVRSAGFEKADADLPRLRQELAEIAPVVEAKKAGRLFSKGFWKATFHGDLVKRAADLEAQIRDAERTAKLDQTPLPAVLTATADGLAEFRTLCDALASVGLTPPAEPTVEAVDAACRAAEGDRQETETAAGALRQRLAELDADPHAAAAQLLNRAAIVVGPRAAHGDPAVTGARFDRVLLESAESVTRTEWAVLTSASERMILLGDFLSHSDPRPANGRPHGPAADLWRQAHRPTWLRDDGRLVVRLAAAEVVSREPLADRPDIELRFGTTAAGEYVLAEVAFPAGMPVAAAKAFAAGELGEVQLEPLGPPRWHGDGLTVCWPLLESPDGVWIDAAAGVREQVVPLDGLPATAAVSFDPAIWTRDAAEAWVNEKSRAARGRRTAVLSAEPALA